MSTDSNSLSDAFKAVTVHTKVKSVLRLLHGENVETVADDLGIPSARLLRWKDKFVEGGRANLLRRRTDQIAGLQMLRKRLMQWTALVTGLMLMIWVVTKIVASMVHSA